MDYRSVHIFEPVCVTYGGLERAEKTKQHRRDMQHKKDEMDHSLISSAFSRKEYQEEVNTPLTKG